MEHAWGFSAAWPLLAAKRILPEATLMPIRWSRGITDPDRKPPSGGYTKCAARRRPSAPPANLNSVHLWLMQTRSALRLIRQPVPNDLEGRLSFGLIQRG